MGNGSKEKCSSCGRGKSFFDGCSIIHCPERKVITAQPAQISQDFESLTLYFQTGCSFKGPSNKE